MMPLSNPRREFGAQLWALADLVQADERRRSFRAKAYRNALWSLDDLPADLEVTRQEVLSVPGLGAGMANLIGQFQETGALAELERLGSLYPREVSRLRRLPRVGQALLRSIKSDLGVETVVDFRRAVDAGDVGALKGVGPATIRLWESIISDELSDGITAHRGSVVAEMLKRHLSRHLETEISVTGEVRRLTETFDVIGLVAQTNDRGALNKFLTETAVVKEADLFGHRVELRTHADERVAIYPTEPSSFGTVLARTTGPHEHIERVLDPIPAMSTETDIYLAKGLPWIPPPARGLEVEEAVKVVRDEQIIGDFHLHTNASPDGRMSLEELIAAVRRRGYRYILVTDHTHGLRFGGLSDEGIAVQAAEIEHIRRVVPDIAIFHGAELNIQADGSLDLDMDALELLDFAVASVHSRFDLDAPTQTKRVVEAIKHPVVRVLGHPTGRRIGIRPPLKLDLDSIFEVAAIEGVALESNGHRDRLDLPASQIEVARSYGCVFVANSDAHRVSELSNVENAVGLLQRAGVTAAEVVNTWDRTKLADWIG